MRVCVDTNVLLDVLAKREPFYADAARIWSLAERGKLEALVSVISFNNIYYVVRKAANRKAADRALRLMRDVFTPITLDAKILGQAIDAGFRDFEDALQFHSAVHADAGFLITRDTSAYPTTDLPVVTPAEFLATASFE